MAWRQPGGSLEAGKRPNRNPQAALEVSHKGGLEVRWPGGHAEAEQEPSGRMAWGQGRRSEQVRPSALDLIRRSMVGPLRR